MLMAPSDGSALKQQCLAYFAKHPPLMLELPSGAAWRIVAGGLLMFTVVGIPIGIWLWLSALLRYRRESQRRAKMQNHLQESAPAFAFIYRAYSGLMTPGDRPGVAVVIFSLDPASATKQTGWFMALSDRIQSIEEDQSDPFSQFMRTNVVDQAFRPNDRVSIPVEFTEGIKVEVGGMMIEPRYLVGNVLSAELPFLPALISPRPDGPIFFIPMQLALTATSGS